METEIEIIELSEEELEYIASRRLNRFSIGIAFGVPEEVLSGEERGVLGVISDRVIVDDSLLREED